MSADTLSVPVGLDLRAAEAIAPELSPAQLVWRRFRRHRMALAGAVGLVLLMVYIVGGSLVIPESASNAGSLRERLQPPTADHWFGTDSIGRDVFTRIIYGGQISIVIGVLAVVLEVTLGTLIGGFAAYYGGWVDAVLMRFTEAMLAIPSLFLLIVLSKFLSNDIPTVELWGRTFSGSVVIVIVVIGCTSWMYLARIVRANVLSLRELDYVSASRALGASHGRIFFSHLVPNTIAPIIVSATLGLAQAVITEAYVSFLGLGVQPPTATWGNMMDQSLSFIQRGVWWMWTFPSLLIVLTILSINLLGDGLRDALDPRTAKHLG
ncbi:MAG: ABC transporter permease [Chloroflexi bacterium]|nr:ABC transporter permease [Chloroflexota bacterium]